MFKFVLIAAVFGLAASSVLDSDVHAEVKDYDNDASPEGNFHYGFKTSNGIEISAAGNADALQGSYKFLTPEGVVVERSYVADAEGFKPVGADIPVAPEIPEPILRALAWNEAHPEPELSQVKSVGK